MYIFVQCTVKYTTRAINGRFCAELSKLVGTVTTLFLLRPAAVVELFRMFTLETATRNSYDGKFNLSWRLEQIASAAGSPSLTYPGRLERAVKCPRWNRTSFRIFQYAHSIFSVRIRFFFFFTIMILSHVNRYRRPSGSTERSRTKYLQVPTSVPFVH